MPSIRILTTRLDRPSKQRIARCFADSVRELLAVPTVEVFFQEYSTLYVNGEELDGGFVTLQLEGPDRPREVLARLCRSLCDNYRAISSDLCCEVNFIYHVNDQDHMGVNGVLLSDRMSKSPGETPRTS